MELGYGTLACTGDSPLLFVIAGVIIIAVVALIVAFVVMRRKK